MKTLRFAINLFINLFGTLYGGLVIGVTAGLYKDHFINEICLWFFVVAGVTILYFTLLRMLYRADEKRISRALDTIIKNNREIQKIIKEVDQTKEPVDQTKEPVQQTKVNNGN